MRSLRESLAAAGLHGPFSLRDSFETFPSTMGEVIRVLNLPPIRLNATDYEELWEKSEQDAQGIACIDGDSSVITIAKKLFLTKSNHRRYEDVETVLDVAHFSDQTDPHLDGCDHFSDPDLSDGLVFFVFEVKQGSESRPGALFVCDLDFRVVGFTEIEPNASNSCCARHPWNGLLYFKDNSAVGRRLRAYDVSGYITRRQAGSDTDWGKPVEIVHSERGDIALRDEEGAPIKIEGDIQGIVFSPNGRMYITHWEAWENAIGKFFTSYVSVFSALTGRRMWFSGEIDFEGDGDEIEGLSLVPSRGEIFFIQTDNDLEVDELYLHRYLIPDDVIAQGGGQVAAVI